MKKTTLIVIIILIAAIIYVVVSPRQKPLPSKLEREAPPPQVTEEPPFLPTSPPEPAPTQAPKPEEKTEMKVNFYALDPDKAEKGEFLGAAELKNGQLVIDVSEPKLREILEKPYSTMAGEVKEAVAIDWLVTYQPGTAEHLRAIAIECWQFGYIGEIEE